MAGNKPVAAQPALTETQKWAQKNKPGLTPAQWEFKQGLIMKEAQRGGYDQNWVNTQMASLGPQPVAPSLKDSILGMLGMKSEPAPKQPIMNVKQ